MRRNNDLFVVRTAESFHSFSFFFFPLEPVFRTFSSRRPSFRRAVPINTTASHGTVFIYFIFFVYSIYCVYTPRIGVVHALLPCVRRQGRARGVLQGPAIDPTGCRRRRSTNFPARPGVCGPTPATCAIERVRALSAVAPPRRRPPCSRAHRPPRTLMKMSIFN